MNAFARFLHPLRRAAAAFFRHDIALRRAEDGVRLVLEDRRSESGQRAPTRAELAERKEQQELAQMRSELAALLDDLPEARQTLRHLVFVEQALGRKGLRALHKLPVDVLQRALEQFEGLVTNWSPVGLASLRSKMAVAIIDREHMDPDAEADAYRTAAVMDNLPELPAVEQRSDDDALAAAYAALGAAAPGAVAQGAVETQSELGSPSARAVARDLTRDASRPAATRPAPAGEIRLRELQS
jgi:hypothetical protein